MMIRTQRDKGFVVRDLPWTEEKLREIPPFKFENWAVIALGGIPNKAPVRPPSLKGRGTHAFHIRTA